MALDTTKLKNLKKRIDRMESRIFIVFKRPVLTTDEINHDIPLLLEAMGFNGVNIKTIYPARTALEFSYESRKNQIQSKLIE